jgi:hypothetical protein
MTLFGTRDFMGPEIRDAAGVGFAHTEPETLGEGTSTIPDDRRILLRVLGGDDIVVGTARDHAEGVHLARRMMRLIDDAEAQGEWPELDDRFIRPSSIVSIDVQIAA